jgi:hypothetical protein
MCGLHYTVYKQTSEGSGGSGRSGRGGVKKYISRSYLILHRFVQIVANRKYRNVKSNDQKDLIKTT